MHTLTGTWRLFRLAVRRDRIKLPLILVLLVAIFASSVQATIDFYGSSQEDLLKYVATTAPSATYRLFNGPIAGANIGSVVVAETLAMILISMAFVSSMAIIRHTRQNEEFGRSELIESGVVAKHASLAAAMLLVLAANLIFALAVFAILAAFDLPVAGSSCVALAVLGVGMASAATAAVAAQLADSSRGANGYGAMAIGASFLIRGIGDVGGKLSADGLSVISAWPSWLTPMGWALEVFPFTTQRVWVFGLFGSFFIATLGLAVVLMARRDVGMGMISTRPGRATAHKSLLSASGLARRLQKGIFRGWALAIIVFSATFGLTIKEFEGFLSENEEVQEVFAMLGGGGTNYREIFLAVLVSTMVLLITGYAVQALLRMRSEESGGQLENVLATGVSRSRWMLSHILIIFERIALLLVFMALSMGISYVWSLDLAYSELWPILQAAFVQAAPIVAFAGFVVFIFGLLPSFSVALAWGGLAFSLLIVQIGALLKLPQWVMDISPFIHSPAMPAADFRWEPVFWLVGVGVLLITLGVIRFGARDITTD